MSGVHIQSMIDLGACHPYIGNDTYIFYDRGYKIINVEPHPDNFKLLKKTRKKDINLDAAIVTNYITEVDFEINKEARLSKVSSKITGYKVKTITIQQLLEYIDTGENFTLKIDIEGSDYLVLEKFLTYEKKAVIVQIETFDGLRGLSNSNFDSLMNQHDYLLVSKTPLNSFYFLKSYWPFEV